MIAATLFWIASLSFAFQRPTLSRQVAPGGRNVAPDAGGMWGALESDAMTYCIDTPPACAAQGFGLASVAGARFAGARARREKELQSCSTLQLGYALDSRNHNMWPATMSDRGSTDRGFRNGSLTQSGISPLPGHITRYGGYRSQVHTPALQFFSWPPHEGPAGLSRGPRAANLQRMPSACPRGLLLSVPQIPATSFP